MSLQVDWCLLAQNLNVDRNGFQHWTQYIYIMLSTSQWCLNSQRMLCASALLGKRLEQPQNNGGAKVGLPQSPAIKENLINKLTTSLLHRCLSTCVFVRLSHQKIPEVKGWMMFWGATIRNVLNAIAYSMCVAVRLSFLFTSMRFLGDASLLCSLAQD